MRKFRLSFVFLHNVLLVLGNEFFSILQHNRLAYITIWEKGEGRRELLPQPKRNLGKALTATAWAQDYMHQTPY